MFAEETRDAVFMKNSVLGRYFLHIINDTPTARTTSLVSRRGSDCISGSVTAGLTGFHHIPVTRRAENLLVRTNGDLHRVQGNRAKFTGETGLVEHQLVGDDHLLGLIENSRAPGAASSALSLLDVGHISVGLWCRASWQTVDPVRSLGSPV